MDKYLRGEVLDAVILDRVIGVAAEYGEAKSVNKFPSTRDEF
jgi:hypothetical protein